MDAAVYQKGAVPLFRKVRSSKAFGPFLLVPLVAALAGCDVSLGNLSARATDEWTHTYPLTAGGEIRIVNTNGRIDVEGVDGSTVEPSTPSTSIRPLVLTIRTSPPAVSG